MPVGVPLGRCSNWETYFETAAVLSFSAAADADKFCIFFCCLAKASYWSACIIFLFTAYCRRAVWNPPIAL